MPSAIPVAERMQSAPYDLGAPPSPLTSPAGFNNIFMQSENHFTVRAEKKINHGRL
jgi:hypothetical protein